MRSPRVTLPLTLRLPGIVTLAPLKVIAVALLDLMSLPKTVKSPATVTFSPLKVRAVALFDLITLPVTVNSFATLTLAPLRLIAIVPPEDCISSPPTLMSPAKVVRVPEVRVMLVVLSDALITVTPDISPRTSSFANGVSVPTPIEPRTIKFSVNFPYLAKISSR